MGQWVGFGERRTKYKIHQQRSSGVEQLQLSGGILSVETPCDLLLCLSSSRGAGDGRRIWDSVFPAQYPGQETSPAFLGRPGCSACLELAYLKACPRRTQDYRPQHVYLLSQRVGLQSGFLPRDEKRGEKKLQTENVIWLLCQSLISEVDKDWLLVPAVASLHLLIEKVEKYISLAVFFLSFQMLCITSICCLI